MTVSPKKPASSLRRFQNALRAVFFIPDPDLEFSVDESELAQLHANTAVATTASVDVQTWGAICRSEL